MYEISYYLNDNEYLKFFLCLKKLYYISNIWFKCDYKI